MLVEDNADLREAIATFLNVKGFEVVLADHGLDALRKLAAGPPPSAIVVDMMMPVMDGWEFLAQCPAGTPIVVVSGVDDVQRTRAHPDVVAVLRKPIAMDRLVAALTPLVPRIDPPAY
jgi:CheY-like chemotaxis protein